MDETILRLNEIRKLSQPSRRNRVRLWDWLCRGESGNNFLRSIEAKPWEITKLREPTKQQELLITSPEHDRLDHWLSDVVTPLYHGLFGHRSKPDFDTEAGLGRLWNYQMRWLHYLGNVVCVLLSSVVPIASIQALYWIPSILERLSLITGLIMVFSFILMFIAGSRRSEVFTGTLAFAAVLVVFLQGLNGAINT